MDNGVIESMPLWYSIPFLVMLLCIALGPMLFEHWWESNKHKLWTSLILGVPVVIIFIAKGLTHELIHQVVFDYVPFIVLLGALFVISGGIHLKGDIEAKPYVNTIFLAIGGILASFMGTTGAAMLLIRPVIRTNSQRVFKVHTILFFIAIVANAGGILTPLGDPPLLLLYLRGASFGWFSSLLPEWSFVLVTLLVVYFIVDSYFYKKEPKEALHADKSNVEPIRLEGCINLIFLLGVILSVAFINEQNFEAMKHNKYLSFSRDAVILLMAVLSLVFTKKKVRYDHNNFTWAPIIEVAYLFLGIFVTMTPALIYLKENAQSFGITQPWQFFYCTGALSSFLDNAPTAVSFYNLALGMVDMFPGATLVANIPEVILKAICLGAVLFGSMTYIGNGPNFMVKAIAEESKIKMPGFFAYMLKFSLIVLLPIYIIAQLIFL